MTNWRAVRWTLAGIAGAAFVLVGAAFVYFEVFGVAPSYHDNPSFRYGENVMETRIYGDATLNVSIKKRCQLEVAKHLKAPADLDDGEAVKGCVYLEYLYDN